MCAILDASTVAEVFGEKRNAPGRQFFEWLETPHARLIVGGRLSRELAKNAAFERWAVTATADGRVRRVTAASVERKAAALARNPSLNLCHNRG